LRLLNRVEASKVRLGLYTSRGTLFEGQPKKTFT
jgi:hypothetical protein